MCIRDRGNAEWRGMGQNYLKSLLALGFQAFLIMVVVGIYAVLIQQIGTADDISGAIWGCMGYTVLLCFCLLYTSSPWLMDWMTWKIWLLSAMAPKGQFTRHMPQDTHLS